MFRIIIILLAAGCFSTLNSQNISIIANGYFHDLSRTCNLNYNYCPQKAAFGFAYHPAGYLIKIREKSIDPPSFRNDSIFFYKYDPISCSESLLYSIKQHNFGTSKGDISIDYLGRIYLYNQRNKSIYRTNSYGDTLTFVCQINDQIGDIVFAKNNIYVLAYYQQKIYHLDINFNILKITTPLLPLKGITSITYSCDSIVYVASALQGISTQTFIDSINKGFWLSSDTTLFLNYNLKDNLILDTICKEKLLIINTVMNVTSPSEFLASDPECDLLIDLDRNNSSGLFPYDYQASASLCVTADETPLCDQDLYLHTSFPLDSVSICITGALNGVDEFIYTTGLPAGFILNKNTDSCWTLFKKNGSDLEYADALKSLRYRNISANRISGLRIIQLQGQNSLKKGSLIRALIQVGKKVTAGQDTSLILCNDKNAIPLNTLLSNTSDKNGHWIPALNSNSDLFNSGIDNYGTYQYVVSDIYCGSDTAHVDIMNGTVIPFELGPDRSICNGEVIDFLIRPPQTNQTYKDILLNGSQSSETIQLSKPGQYIIAVQSDLGCWAYDTILISKSTQVIPLDSTISICENLSYIYKNKIYHSQDIINDTITAINGCDTVLTLRLIPMANIPKNQVLNLCPGDTFFYKNDVYLSGDIIHDTLSGINTCDTIFNLQLIPYPISKVSITADTLICKNKTTLITASATNKYLWSSGETSPTITKGPGTYQLTVTDYNLCTTVSSITIKEAPPIEYLVEPYDPLCSDDRGRIIMQRVQGGIPPVRYLLNSVENKSGIFDNLNPGQYIATFIDAIGCEIKDTIIILPAAAFDVSVTNLIEIDKGASVLVNYTATQGQIQNIRFDPNQDISQEGNALRIMGTQDRDYTITFIDSNGCEITHQLQIRIIDHEEFFIPNLFSPNHDNVNDTWQPTIGTSLEVLQIAVYDRWGESVFSTSDRNTGWNGLCHNKPCLPGVYVYMIQVKDKTGKIKTYSGDLTLIR
ncbi:MAG: gliding motility-associated C-terminal domain-containing protein [Saprospiraceae bacterium]|uniref:Gliding motility-associated C-terminal domain-containing protein n=1 Tax=Candidatus Defluviibacterium haderslevense TaxID=2981993 RepID=A0A9D7S6R2_9BACT|nr:gliding motility-associated C-terminal domain-containing protein [Candidatus Defluviibacterium haderslevense]